jgi:hypothetical protein
MPKLIEHPDGPDVMQLFIDKHGHPYEWNGHPGKFRMRDKNKPDFQWIGAFLNRLPKGAVSISTATREDLIDKWNDRRPPTTKPEARAALGLSPDKTNREVRIAEENDRAEKRSTEYRDKQGVEMVKRLLAGGYRLRTQQRRPRCDDY